MAGGQQFQPSRPQEAVHESRQTQVFGNAFNPPKGPRKHEQPRRRRQQESSTAVNEIKKQMRNVRRRLEGLQNLPADVRMEDERALASYEQALASVEAEKTRQEMISKYHMVRFFERQKATRSIKKIKKQILAAKTTDEVDALQSELHFAEVDLNYSLNFPLSESYVAMYPRKEDGEGYDGSVIRDPKSKHPAWAEIEKIMEEGGNLDEIRYRPAVKTTHLSRPLEIRAPRPKPAADVDTSGLNRRERRSMLNVEDRRASKVKSRSAGFEKNQAFSATQAPPVYGNRAEDGDDSDGGFFEEG